MQHILFALLFLVLGMAALLLSEYFFQARFQNPQPLLAQLDAAPPAEPTAPEPEPAPEPAPQEAPAASAAEKRTFADVITSGWDKQRIIVYAIYALLSMLCGAMAVLTIGVSRNLIIIAFGFFCVAAAAFVDQRTRTIPNIIPLGMILGQIVIFIVSFAMGVENLISFTLFSLVGAVITFIVLFLLHCLTKGGFGMGDVKLLTAIAWLCGCICVFSTLFFGVLCTTICSVVLLATKKGTLKTSLPFGPFLFIGYVISVVLGTC